MQVGEAAVSRENRSLVLRSPREAPTFASGTKEGSRERITRSSNVLSLKPTLGSSQFIALDSAVLIANEAGRERLDCSPQCHVVDAHAHMAVVIGGFQ